MVNVLIVDDEPAIRQMIRDSLEMVNFNCIEAEDGLSAHSKVIDNPPDLVLLDWMLPGLNGIELARRLKKDDLTSEIPIIMLTAKTEEDNKVSGLDAGADDYIIKPFSTRELVSRINAVLRRSKVGQHEKSIVVENLSLDPIGHRITSSGEKIDMGPTEYRLLKFFMTHQERAYSRAQLLDHVWGGNVYVEDRTVDVHIRRLRKALSPHGGDRFVQTVRGVGYRFSVKT